MTELEHCVGTYLITGKDMYLSQAVDALIASAQLETKR